MLFSLLKHYLDLCISDTALKVFRSLYCFTTSICHGVENYFPRLWGTGISDAIFFFIFSYASQNLSFLKRNSVNCSSFIISRRALAREGDYEMMPVCACVRACVRALVSHADSSKTTTATDFL